MKKGVLSLLAWSLPFLLIAQSNTSTQSMVTKEGPGATEGKGIQWAAGLSWEQIKQKAKAENKYIFLDCYTTWCGPCKKMDKYVYPNDTVASFFNKHFISVKVQMEKTSKDDQNIKDWYNDAAVIEKEFVVVAYPSLIFLSPDANILQKETGSRTVKEFVAIAKEALIPDKIYNNPFREYRTLVEEYKQGIRHYNRMPFMIKEALELNDTLAKTFFREFVEYTSNLNEKERYTKENISAWSMFIVKLDSKVLGYFLNDGEKIDKVVNKIGYSKDVVDQIIQTRIVDSFFRMQKGETKTLTGARVTNSEIMFMNLPTRRDGKIEQDLAEADWETLKKMISEHFDKDYVIRNLLKAKVRWYKQHQNMASMSKTYFGQLDKYPPADLSVESGSINQNAWDTFRYLNDKKLLNKASIWMERVIQYCASLSYIDTYANPLYLDTYANLLFKLGRSKEAVSWEEKAIELLKIGDPFGHLPGYQITLEQMKKGEPTYLNEGAIWPKEK